MASAGVTAGIMAATDGDSGTSNTAAGGPDTNIATTTQPGGTQSGTQQSGPGAVPGGAPDGTTQGATATSTGT